MNGGNHNLPASVTARLLNRARETGQDYQNLLTDFCLERFLFRLGESLVSDRFVLKGAMLLRVWSDRPYPATRDLDLLRNGDGSADAVRDDIHTICAAKVKPDAVTFDPVSAQIEPIRPEDSMPARASSCLPIAEPRSSGFRSTRAWETPSGRLPKYTLTRRCCSFLHPGCSHTRERRSSPKSLRQSWSSATGTAASRISLICTTLQATSNLSSPFLWKRYAEHLTGATRLSPPKSPSG